MTPFYFTNGDLEYFWKEQIQAFSWLPDVSGGLLSLWLNYPFRIVLKLLTALNFSWFFIENLLWVSVFVLAIYSSYRLTKNWLTPMIYAANTYFLLLVKGGQLGVAAAYAYAPFLFFRFLKHPNEKIVNGLYFAILMVFDIRIAFLVGLAIGYRSILSLLVAASVHLYWILPMIFAQSNIPAELTNSGMLKFLSFADFSHAISLLHPNWPENLFGKVYFMQPEFLLIPILAFAAISKKTRYFVFLALIGAFFAKGVNEPIGGIFNWLFTNIPGFVLFRDPTKFYVYIALAYSVLIPLTLKKSRYGIILFLAFWLFILRGANVQLAKLPQEYVQLKNMLVEDPVPSRILWIPQKERFAYYSDVHPIVTATSTASLDSSVKYVVVPIDVGKRIFLDDYKFDSVARERVIASITLPRDPRFADLAVFENPNFEGLLMEASPVEIKQQKHANIGLALSITFLILWIFLH